MSDDASSPVILLLAAGAARRFGSLKQLALIQHEPMVRRATRTALDTGVPVIVVTGCGAPEVEQALAGLAARIVRHPEWSAGMGDSLAAGTRQLKVWFPQAASALVCLADQPLLPAALLGSMLERHRSTPGRILATSHAGQAGVPALFPRACFDALSQLSGAMGARALLATLGAQTDLLAHETGPDVDTPADLAHVAARLLVAGDRLD